VGAVALVIGEVKPGFLADGRGNGTLIPVPPPQGGALGWGAVYLSFGADFADVTLRIAIWNSVSKAWRINNALRVPAAGDRAMVDLTAGDMKVSVGRVKSSNSDTPDTPCSWMIETALKA
jgi:hypothetical protein